MSAARAARCRAGGGARTRGPPGRSRGLYSGRAVPEQPLRARAAAAKVAGHGPAEPVLLIDCRPAPNPRRVRMFLAEKGLALPTEQVDIMAGEQFRAHAARVGTHHVPALLLEDGRCLTESVAICRYIEALTPEPNLMGRDPLEAAEIEMWQRRVEFQLLQPIAFVLRHGNPKMAVMEDQCPEWAEANRPRVLDGLAWLDARLGRARSSPARASASPTSPRWSRSTSSGRPASRCPRPARAWPPGGRSRRRARRWRPEHVRHARRRSRRPRLAARARRRRGDRRGAGQPLRRAAPPPAPAPPPAAGGGARPRDGGAGGAGGRLRRSRARCGRRWPPSTAAR